MFAFGWSGAAKEGPAALGNRGEEVGEEGVTAHGEDTNPDRCNCYMDLRPSRSQSSAQLTSDANRQGRLTCQVRSPVVAWLPLLAAIGVWAILSGHFLSGQGHTRIYNATWESRIRPMNSPARVIGFVNAAHFIDHYAMLIFAAAVIVMG